MIGKTAAGVLGSECGSPARKLATRHTTKPTAAPAALAPSGCWRGPRLSRTPESEPKQAAAMTAISRAGGTAARSWLEKMAATPAKATSDADLEQIETLESERTREQRRGE